MNLKIRKEAAEAIGLDNLEKAGVLSSSGWAYNNHRIVDLNLLDPKQVDALEKFFERIPRELPNVPRCRFDIALYKKAQKDPGQRARNCEQMATLMKLYLSKVDGHRVYRSDGEHWLAHYVNRVVFHPKEHSRGDRVIPAWVGVEIVWEYLGGRTGKVVHLQEEDCRGRTPSMALQAAEYVVETPDLRAAYLGEKARFDELQPRVGLQLETRGRATDDLDGNKDEDDDRWSWWRRVGVIETGSDAEPGRAVVDVFKENPKEDNEDEDHAVDSMFWAHNKVKRLTDDFEELSEADQERVSKAQEAGAAIEVPLHPYLATFDLKRHKRLRIHVNNVEVHRYDKDLSEKLVLPRDMKDLVKLLVEHRAGGFRDIVAGKTGGAVVLLAGPPGTGKTLTAEVYAESEQRPLYSVQCSQLGVSPSDLEKNLALCFRRASRWNAVMLLDEADVYVRRRGDDLNQNAIVGVFLRVLEYQGAVLFLTTNRPEDVDDAVASRCVAKLTYRAPTDDEQRRIWRILADGAGIAMGDKEIAAAVKANAGLSGRDVKNLLKLAALSSRGKAVTAEAVEFVKQFKPTTTEGPKQ